MFPKIFDSYLKESLIARARKNKIIEIKIHDLRDFAIGKHKKVDDRPFGGGPGMVLMFEPIYKAVEAAKGKALRAKAKKRVILFSTRGKKLNSATTKRLAKYNQLILICGRYEGVDERVAKHVADEEISIGDYVLSGGELPALVLIETVSRFLMGFLGKYESLEEIKGSYPVYTRPETIKIRGKKLSAPKILISGNHAQIRKWRREER
ncbi:MAG: tRNA (guanosine(37)-N1)-methyltransferase TrmD [Candidatus Liptonbacteria bacterium]|nr:tRNA (guanosine(37)-N1)-methyltransferase TrmD [Candidatus Liptonbacteria bacterium]